MVSRFSRPCAATRHLCVPATSAMVRGRKAPVEPRQNLDVCSPQAQDCVAFLTEHCIYHHTQGVMATRRVVYNHEACRGTLCLVTRENFVCWMLALLRTLLPPWSATPHTELPGRELPITAGDDQYPCHGQNETLLRVFFIVIDRVYLFWSSVT